MMGVKKKSKTCYLYIRVSTAIQVDGYSLEAQEDRLRKEAEHRGYEVLDVYCDEGKSGKNIAGREDFQRMIEDIFTVLPACICLSAHQSGLCTLQGHRYDASDGKWSADGTLR